MTQTILAQSLPSSRVLEEPYLAQPGSTLTTRPSLHVLQPLQRPIIAEIDLFDMAEFMDCIELTLRQAEGYRAMSKFKLWEPLFSDYAAVHEPDLYKSLFMLIEENHSTHLRWSKASFPTHSDPMIFTALPVVLCRSLLGQTERGPEYLFTSRWSLHALPTLARQSILDDLLE
jgi:hypothetical protein